MMRRIQLEGGSLMLLLLLYSGLVLANTDGTVFLERGHRGIVPCPPVKSRQISPENVDAMYWYYGSTSDTSLLISHFLGRVDPQNGIPEGVYDIDNEFNLIIENVTASNEGTYFFEVNQRLNMIEKGQVEVCDKVSPSRPYPTVIGCNQDHDADTCEVRVRHDSKVHNLTCDMEQVKPAVELRWIRLFLGGKTELNASTTVRPAYTGTSFRNNTYSTSASVQVAAVDDEEVYVCEAMGIAVGDGARTIVRLTKTYDEVQSSINQGSPLRNAYEVYVCEAMGDAVGKRTHLIVRFTKTRSISTVATFDEVQYSNIQDLIDEITQATCTSQPVLTILLAVLIILIILIVVIQLRRCNDRRKKKPNEYNRTPKTESCLPLKNDTSEC